MLLPMQDPGSAALIRRTFQQRLNDPPVLSFGPLPKQAGGGQLHETGLALRFSALRDALPFNVHLLTLKALPKDCVLLRLAHLYQVTVHSALRTVHTHSKYNACHMIVMHPCRQLLTCAPALPAID